MIGPEKCLKTPENNLNLSLEGGGVNPPPRSVIGFERPEECQSTLDQQYRLKIRNKLLQFKYEERFERNLDLDYRLNIVTCAVKISLY